MSNKTNNVIVIGGGLSGLSAAHTALENGCSVVLIEKNMFCGGNSTKATSGINGALTSVQKAKHIGDSVQSFLRDTALSASKGKTDVPHDLARVLVENSAGAVNWLIQKFRLDLSILGRLGGHSFPRTHRGPKRFPGMEITYALMKAFEKITEQPNAPARLLTKSKATRLLRSPDGEVVGVEYADAQGNTKSEHGAVVIATGGFAADYSSDGILAKVRPDLLGLPTTNGEHCTGDGIKMAQQVGADCVDLAHVQVHPTGLVNPAEPNAKTIYLAAEALRGCGALMLDCDGKRFVDELGRRDYVSGEMFKRNKAPYRLVLNGKASKEIDWHCKHYTARGLMKRFNTGAELAQEMNISPETLSETFRIYSDQSEKKSDPFGKKFFSNAPFSIDDFFYVSIVTPVNHYCMGGIKVDTNSAVLSSRDNAKIPGLFASGEVIGGVHGINRLGGSSLLDCVVYGRLAGGSAARYLKAQKAHPQGKVSQSLSAGDQGFMLVWQSGNNVLDLKISSLDKSNIQTQPLKPERVNELETNTSKSATSEHDKGAQETQTQSANKKTKDEDEDSAEVTSPKESSAQPVKKAAEKGNSPTKSFTLKEVAEHNKEDDCWIVVNGKVINATTFLDDHPGGKKAIMIYAGKDATEEFNMVHEANVIKKYAAHLIVGELAKEETAASKL